MKWKKLGLVFCPTGGVEWMQSHATNPVVEFLEGDLFRIYFSPRDSKNRGQIASLVMKLSKGTASVVDGSLRHVLTHGKNGRFDDSGVTVTGLVYQDTQRLLYYLGWNRSVTIPFRNAIGVALSEQDSQEFVRVSQGPLIDRNNVDPISISYPFLLWDEGRYRIWYGSCVEWDGPKTSDYEFSLKYADSNDGLNWTRTGEVTLGCNPPHEDAIARPHVIRESNLFKMWYSKKKGPFYRMGYAESVNGKDLVRMDDTVGIDVSEDSDWDSEMIEYPFIFDHDGQRYMLYNGNGYGKTGFGLAVLEQG